MFTKFCTKVAQKKPLNVGGNLQGWNKLSKSGKAKNIGHKKFLQLPPLFQFAPAHLVGAHALFAIQLRPCML